MGVVSAHDHLLGAILLVLNDLLEDMDLATDKLLLQAAFEFFLRKEATLLEQSLFFVDQKDTVTALEKQVVHSAHLLKLDWVE